MGEAKKRGTFEQRRTLAMEKKAFEDMERRKAEIERQVRWAERRAADNAEREAKGLPPLPEHRVRASLLGAALAASASAEALALARTAVMIRRGL